MKSGPSEASQLFEQWLKQRTMSTIHPPSCHLEWVHRKEIFGEGIKRVNSIALFHKYPHLLPQQPLSDEPVKASSRKRSVSFDARANERCKPANSQPVWMPSPMTEREQNLLKLMCTHYLPKESPTLTPSVRLKVRRYLQYLMFVDAGFKDYVLCNSDNASKLLQTIGILLAAKDNKRLPVHKAVQMATSRCVDIPVILRNQEASAS